MSRKACWGLLALALALAAGPGRAGGQAKDEKPKPDSSPAEVIVRFNDGSVVRRVTFTESIEVMTKYGKLTIPATDIRRIDFGLHMADEDTRKLDDAIRLLGSDDFQKREAATKDLLSLGRLAYPALQKAAKDSDLERARRAQALLSGLKEKISSEQLSTRPEDLIYTRESVIAGKIVSGPIKGKTEYFGELVLKVGNLRSLHSTSGSGEQDVTLEAAKYGIQPNTWFDTEYLVGEDHTLVVTASGQIDLTPQQPGQFPSEPDGNRNAGQNGQYIMGTLLGKVGESGKVFVVGKRYEGKPGVEGKLYLHVVPVQYGGVPPSGSYKVKIASNP